MFYQILRCSFSISSSSPFTP